MPDLGYIALVAAGFGAYWWQHLRPHRARKPASDTFTPDAEVALHVANHEAKSRGHEAMSSVHVLYGLVQDETITGAIRKAGGDVDALEDRVLAALGTAPTSSDDARQVVMRAVVVAQQAERRASCTDLWAYLAETAAATLLEACTINRGTVLFTLFHGISEQETPIAAGDVFIVLRNDDYTTHEFVHRLLQDVFAVPADKATELTMTTHTAGRAVIARLAAEVARTKIAEARTLARAHGFPLWIDAEPA